MMETQFTEMSAIEHKKIVLTYDSINEYHKSGQLRDNLSPKNLNDLSWY